ncbi:MAG: isocitrate lyase/phosphoenolpyruvate mutase family protein [Microbacteriaceae bacterium]|nr:isocitrate lyase/phosphoenolpyruvate mutase family protein [Microbacteriaceae bacterium]
MTSLAEKAQLLGTLHVPGKPLILVNVWDAITARTVASAPGVKALATASHSISAAHDVADGGGLGLEAALNSAKLIIDAVDLPVTVDFEKGYGSNPSEVQSSVTKLLEVGAAGFNIEDSPGSISDGQFEVQEAASRVAASRKATELVGVPAVINARVDSFLANGDWSEARTRANSYLDAGADVIFMFGLDNEEKVERAVREIEGKVSVIAGPRSVPLKRLAELGVCRVSFGGRPLGLTLSHLKDAASTLTALAEYPSELGFDY